MRLLKTLHSSPSYFPSPMPCKERIFRFPQRCGEFIHIFQRGVKVEKRGIFAKNSENWRNNQNFYFGIVKNIIFSTRFSTSCGKSSTGRGGCLKEVENPLENFGFSTGGETPCKATPDQLPLISLIISSISARKTGFCIMRFSTASREERTVEWSLSMTLPILGRDISVI